MTEMLRGQRIETGSSPRDNAIVLDSHLNWLQPHRHAPRSRAGHWSPLEQALADLHARYERACIED
jgi:hypothetical protein